jgi:putative transposase
MAKARCDAETRDLIEKVQAEFPFYGYRRVHHHLERLVGVTINEKKIRRIMDDYGLKALIWKGFKVKTTDSNHDRGYAPNLLPGRTITGLNQVWVTDVTYIRILTGFVYLAAILDLFSRKVIGWAISKRIDQELCLEALKMAVTERRPPRGCIHHSDRGVQYTSDDYRRYCRENELEPSMSAKGYCYDNAFMESWFKTLKAEEVYLCEYETYNDVIASVSKFIEQVYNAKRLHSSLGYLCPNEFEFLLESGLLKKDGVQPVLNLRGEPSN